MTSTATHSLTIDEVTETLFNFSIDRSDMQELLSHFSVDAKFNRTAIEYEIQILRILVVGWGISYFVKDNVHKEALSESFWNSIRDFSQNLSTISKVSMVKNFDYFDVMKQRLDTYIKQLNIQKNVNEPAAVVGPTFAELCGHSEEAVVVWLGNKMFKSVLYQIQTYLSNVQFVESDISQKKQFETKI